MTTLNEAQSLPHLLRDVAGQTRVPDEFIVVDAGSTDATLDCIPSAAGDLAALGTRTRVEVLPCANIARGRNRAIDLASGSIIAVTDCGCRLDPNWLQRLVAPFEDHGADFVGGFFLPVAHTSFQRVVARLTTSDTPPAHGFLPSSRSVAFTKEMWQRAGGYPEWLPWGEDTLFDQRCLAVGARFHVAADAIVRWEVRGDFRSLAKQYFCYSYGDGVAGRYSVSEVAIAAAYLTSAIGLMKLGAVALAVPLVLALSWILRRRLRLSTLPLALAIAVTIQASRVVGFMRGTARRLMRHGATGDEAPVRFPTSRGGGSK